MILHTKREGQRKSIPLFDLKTKMEELSFVAKDCKARLIKLKEPSTKLAENCCQFFEILPTATLRQRHESSELFQKFIWQKFPVVG